MAAIDPNERTINELREALDRFDDPEQLREILDAEADGQDRKGAKEAIEERLVEVEDDAEATGSEDETESEAEATEDAEELEAMSEAQSQTSDDETTSDHEPDDESTHEDETEDAEETDETQETDVSHDSEASIIDVRNHVVDVAADLIGRRLDGISAIERNDEGWRVVVNVLERHSVPDTQDILGRYEMEVDSSGNIQGYRRLDRYRRGDTTREEEY